MKFGLAIMNDFPPGMLNPSKLAELREQVGAARKSGFESVWVLQHYLGNMPTLQPIPLIASLAEHADGMDVGTNMFILPLRHPVAVAEEFATIDHLSGGNVIAGFGMGYRDNEFESFGVPMDERVGRFEESVEIIRELWSGRTISYQGKHFQLDEQRISLEPVQPYGPKIWIGAGAHKTGARRAARLGDAWIIPPHVTPDRLDVVLGHYRAERDLLGKASDGELVVRRELVLDENPDRAREIGVRARGALTQKYSAFNAPDASGVYKHLDGANSAEEVADQSYLFTDPDTAVEKLKALEKQGITYVILRMQWYDLPQDRLLKTMELFRDRVLPEFASSPA